MGATYLLCMAILVPVFILADAAESLPFIAFIFLCGVIGLALTGFFIMLVILGNRFHVRFNISNKGVSYETMDQRLKTLARLAVAAGSLTGNPTAAGSGILSISRETLSLKWSSVFKTISHPGHYTIRLRDRRRDILHIYCTPENYETVEKLVKSNLPKAVGGNTT